MDESLQRYVGALVGVADLGARILGHMSRWQRRTGGGGDPPAAVLGALMGGVLEPLAAAHEPARLDAAAALLEATLRTLERELVLVAPPGPRRRRPRRRP